MAEWITVTKLAELPPGQSRVVEREGHRIAVFNSDGVYFAVADRCPHAGGPLSEGEMFGHVVVCPWHGANFDLDTGAPMSSPAKEPVAKYEVRVEGEAVQVRIP